MASGKLRLPLGFGHSSHAVGRKVGHSARLETDQPSQAKEFLRLRVLRQ
jgi:hypothetical protein